MKSVRTQRAGARPAGPASRPGAQMVSYAQEVRYGRPSYLVINRGRVRGPAPQGPRDLRPTIRICRGRRMIRRFADGGEAPANILCAAASSFRRSGAKGTFRPAGRSRLEAGSHRQGTRAGSGLRLRHVRSTTARVANICGEETALLEKPRRARRGSRGLEAPVFRRRRTLWLPGPTSTTSRHPHRPPDIMRPRRPRGSSSNWGAPTYRTNSMHLRPRRAACKNVEGGQMGIPLARAIGEACRRALRGPAGTTCSRL